MTALAMASSTSTMLIVITVRAALAVSAMGIRGHDTFPPTKKAARGVMAISVVLILAAMATAVLTA